MRAVSPTVVPRSTEVDMRFEWERRWCLADSCRVHVNSVCVIICGEAAPQGQSDAIESTNSL